MNLLTAKSSIHGAEAVLSLFQGQDIPRHRLDRPLGLFSDFVAEDLPRICSVALSSPQARMSFATKLHTLVSTSNSPSLKLPSDSNRELACLDLTILQAAGDHLDVPIPRPITDLLQRLCRELGRIDTFLYEDCVLINPLTDDPRLFTTGESGRNERDFLLVHSEIEKTLEKTLTRLASLLGIAASLENPTPDECLSVTQAELQWIEQLLAALRGMKRELFLKFRPFYASSPTTSAPGPSGRYSGKFYLLRVLTEGDALDQVLPAYRHEVRESLPYFPRLDRALLQEWSESPTGMSRLPCLRTAADRDSRLPPLLHLVRQSLDRFTAIHYGLVHRYLITSDESERSNHD